MSILPLAVLIGLMLILAIVGLPLAYAILSSSIIVLLAFTDLPLWQVIQRIFSGIDSFVLTAIPFFLLAGNIMNTGSITRRLIDLSSTMVGHVRGGLAHINVLVSLIFGGVSGSAVADTSGIGTVLIPSMIKKGYTKSFSVTVTATSSVLGQIIPPSLIMIIYSATAGASVQAMFIAGILPGILLAFSMMLVSYIYAIKYHYPREEKKTFFDFLHALKGSILVLIMPILIIGGVLSGVFTATESAVIAVIYSLVISLFIDKSLAWSDLIPIFIKTAKGTAVSLICIGAAGVLGYLMAYFRIHEYVMKLMTDMNLSQNGFIVFIAVLFLIVGTFMDAAPAIAIFVPIVVPVGLALGLHPIHLGMMICLILAFGLVTPPYGLCLLLGCQIADINPRESFKDLIVMLGAVSVTLAIIIFIPDLILWLPRLLAPRFV